jgi:H2-forming N5,N10-methylenetetrahydromethanopterin dehydrogenase-like enzyme
MDWKRLKMWFIRKFGTTGQYISVLLDGVVREELEHVLPIATTAVAMVSANPTLIAPGPQQEAAVVIILAQLALSQIYVGRDIINLAIEIAVQNRKYEYVVPTDTTA